MRFYVVYGIYGIYNLVIELVTLQILVFSIPCFYDLLRPTEFIEMRTSDSLITGYMYMPIVQGSVWSAAVALISLLIFYLNRLYLSRMASIVDTTKIALLTAVVFVIFNFVSISTLVYLLSNNIRFLQFHG